MVLDCAKTYNQPDPLLTQQWIGKVICAVITPKSENNHQK